MQCVFPADHLHVSPFAAQNPPGPHFPSIVLSSLSARIMKYFLLLMVILVTPQSIPLLNNLVKSEKLEAAGCNEKSKKWTTKTNLLKIIYCEFFKSLINLCNYRMPFKIHFNPPPLNPPLPFSGIILRRVFNYLATFNRNIQVIYNSLFKQREELVVL